MIKTDNKILKIIPTDAYDVIEKYYNITKKENLILWEANSNETVIKLLSAYVNKYWLKEFKKLDLGVNNINVYEYRYVDDFYGMLFIFYYYIHFNKKLYDKKNNILNLFDYKLNEELYKNKKDLMQFVYKHYKYTTSEFVYHIKNLKNVFDNARITSNYIDVFLKYLLKDKIEYHVNNNTFEKFIQTYSGDEKYIRNIKIQ